MTVVFPDGVDAQGNASLWWVPSLADRTKPTPAEINAGVNLSCAIDGFAPTTDQGSTQDLRYCSTAQYENPGRAATTIDAVNYVYDPQTPEDSTAYKHYKTLKQGVKGFLVNRLGVPFDDAVAAGDIVDVYPVTAGVQARQAIDPSADGSKLKVSQKFFVTGEVELDAVVTTAGL